VNFASSAEITEIKIPDPGNILSLDLECWDAIIYRELSGQTRPPCEKCRDDAEMLLEMVSEAGMRATCFVVGDLAQKFPGLIKKIDALGHEIASHGYLHKRVYNSSAEEFEADLEKSLSVLSDLTGKAVLGYRAPAFSVRASTPWFFDILLKHGIKYDSSIMPLYVKERLFPDFPRGPAWVAWNRGRILEAPLSTLEFLSRRLPVAGGGYFRLLPMTLIRKAVRMVNKAGLPFVAYLHPYEFRRPRLDFSQYNAIAGKIACKLKSLRFNLLRRTIPGKFAALLREFKFTSMREAFKDEF
jgi:polysaccharide deacetylase family protein (PEP-CTERM system associated)